MGDFVTNWKKVELENGKTKMKIVEVESESTQFKEDMKMQTKAFTEHVDRVGEQYFHLMIYTKSFPRSPSGQ
jgi:hypothetical protein